MQYVILQVIASVISVVAYLAIAIKVCTSNIMPIPICIISLLCIASIFWCVYALFIHNYFLVVTCLSNICLQIFTISKGIVITYRVRNTLSSTTST